MMIVESETAYQPVQGNNNSTPEKKHQKMQIRESNLRSNPKNAASMATRSQTVEIEEGSSAERKAAAAAK